MTNRTDRSTCTEAGAPFSASPPSIMSVRESQRDKALRLTNGTCWLCSIKMDDACRIVPRAEYDGIKEEYRQLPHLQEMWNDDVGNLVILCPNHHRLYDCRAWTIVPNADQLIDWIHQAEATVLAHKPHAHPHTENIIANIYVTSKCQYTTYGLLPYTTRDRREHFFYYTQPNLFLRHGDAEVRQLIKCHRASLCIRAHKGSLQDSFGVPEQNSGVLLKWLLHLWKVGPKPLLLIGRPHDLLPDLDGHPTRAEMTAFASTFAQAPGGAVHPARGVNDCFKDSKSQGSSDCAEDCSILGGTPNGGGTQDTIQDYLDSISQGNPDVFLGNTSNEAVDDEPPVSLKSLQESGRVGKLTEPFCIAGPNFSTNDILRQSYGLELGDTLSLES